MIRLPPRPVLDWKTIAEKAKSFSAEHDLARRPFPLDVDEIAEFDLGIETRFSHGGRGRPPSSLRSSRAEEPELTYAI